jgi:hypothetical protein
MRIGRIQTLDTHQGWNPLLTRFWAPILAVILAGCAAEDARGDAPSCASVAD